MSDRAMARRLAERATISGDPLGWFEPLYLAAENGTATVPWADLAPNPHLTGWTHLNPDTMRTAVVVGCGYGDDAEWLAGRGLDVTAFDIAPTAIHACRRRFPDSSVNYRVVDLLDLPAAWTRQRYDLVVEAYTLQVLPPGSHQRRAAIQSLAAITGSVLLIIARGRDEDDPLGDMPWPLLPTELDSLAEADLRILGWDDYYDTEDPPVRRFRVTFSR